MSLLTLLSGPSYTFATSPLALDFKAGTYNEVGTSYALTALPGYAYSRTGQVSFINASGTVTDFAANVAPVLSGIGYQAYDALTNSLLQSKTLDNASWSKSATTITADAATAPDGTTTADKIVSDVSTGNHPIFQSVGKTAAVEQWTGSIFLAAGGWNYACVRLDAGGASAVQLFVDLTTGLIVGTPTASGFSFTAAPSVISLGGGWYRIIVRTTTDAGASLRMLAYTTNNSGITNATGDGVSGMFAWQPQLIKGDLPDGGPIIATTTAAASIGAPTLSASLANGGYNAVYSFIDGTTQTVSRTVSGGAATLDTYPTVLNQPTVQSVAFTSTASSAVGSAAGSGAASGVGASTALSTGSASGTGLATGVGKAQAQATGAASGTGTAAAVPIVSGSAAGTGSASATGASSARGVGSSAGTGAASAAGQSIGAGTGSSAGTGSASGVGRSTATGDGAAAGTGSASGIAAPLARGTGSAAGAGTASGVSSSGLTSSGAGSASGTGSASAVGQSIALAPGSASGSGAATASGSAQASGQGSASGTGVGTATGVAQARSTGASAANGTASGAGASTATTAGSSAGTGAANANGTGVVTAAGASSASGTAAGQSAAYSTGVGLSAGLGIAVGVGQSIAQAAGFSAANGSAIGAGSATYVNAPPVPASRTGRVIRGDREGDAARSSRIGMVSRARRQA